MAIKKSTGEHAFDVVNIIVMLFLMGLMLFPLLHVFMASLSDSNEVMQHRGILFWPIKFNIGAYIMVMKNPNILTGYQVTLIVVILGTLLSILLTSFGAYVLSRKETMWRNLFMAIIVFTMFFSGGMIPFYLLVNNTLHLGNNLLALILPVAISTWNLLVMQTSFSQIPESLIESAKMDGANDFLVLFRIVMPLSMAVIAVMVLFYGVGHWNSWFNAVLFIRDRDMYPLQLILREILIQNSTNNMMLGVGGVDQEAIGESIKYATVMVATIPILCIYPFLQRYFVKGVMLGSVKG